MTKRWKSDQRMHHTYVQFLWTIVVLLGTIIFLLGVLVNRGTS